MKQRVGVWVAMAVGVAVAGQGAVGVRAQEAVSKPSAMVGQQASAPSATLKIVASDTTKTYHRAACRFVGKIKPAHLVEFASADEAQKTGYTPCKTCLRQATRAQ